MASSGSSADLVQLANDIARLFNKEELVLFCDGLGMDYEDFAGDTRSAKIRELTRHYDRRGRLQELVDAINRERPDAKLQIPYKSSKPQTENRPLSPANILSGIIVTVVGGLIVFWVTQIITSNASPISTPTVAPAVISLASTLTPQPSPSNEPTSTTEPSPIPATPTTAVPTDSPTATSMAESAQLPTPTNEPVNTPIPTLTPEPSSTAVSQPNSFPCMGTITHTRGTRVTVYNQIGGGSIATTLNVGRSVSVIQPETGQSGIWYEIVYEGGSGHVSEKFILLGDDCPKN